MPKKCAISYREVMSPITDPVTKFGGQAVWVAEPRWPLSHAYGTPMQFICQIMLTKDIFGELPGRMAYVFISDDHEYGYIAGTWEPEGGENAVILQPGGLWDGPYLTLREGPSLYRRMWREGAWLRTPCEFAVELRPGEDPREGLRKPTDSDDAAAWDAYFFALFEDKIGGAPSPPSTAPNASNQTMLILTHCSS
jgi:hypothetical protein